MRYLYLHAILIILSLILVVSSHAQTIPNGDFETWNSNSSPTDWVVEGGTAMKTNGVGYTVTDSASGAMSSLFRPVYDGQYALQLNIAIVNGNAQIGEIQNKFPCTSRPNYLAVNLAYGAGIDGEKPLFLVYLYKYNSTTKKRDTVLWTGTIPGPGNAEPWTLFTIDLSKYYKNSVIPDSAYILAANTGTVQGHTSQVTTLIMERMWFAATKPASIRLSNGEQASMSAFPNPFSESTTFHYTLKEEAKVSLSVYDLEGRLISKPVEERQSPGRHTAIFDGAGLKPGIYLYQLQYGNNVETGKIILRR